MMNLAFGAIVAIVLVGPPGFGVAHPARANSGPLRPSPAPAAAAPLLANPAFEKRLAALDAAMEKTTDFRADFEQVKHSPLLKKPLVSKGVLTSKGRLVRWETTEPRHVILLINSSSNSPPRREGATEDGTGAPPSSPQPLRAASAGEMRVYYPDDRLCEIYPIGDALGDFAGALLPRLGDLRERFTLSPIRPSELGGADDNLALVGVLLRPTSDDLRQRIASIKILVDETIPSAIKIIVSDADGEHNEITLTSIRINAGMKDADVQLTLPQDVQLSYPPGAGAETPQPAATPSASDPSSSPGPDPRPD